MAFSFSSLTRFSRPTLVVKFVSSNFRYRLRHYLVNFKVFCTLPFFSLHPAQMHCRKNLTVPDGTSRVKIRVRVSDAELKYKWLDSLSYPFYNMGRFSTGETAEQHEEASSPKWIMGIDPDISGALALLKEDSSGYTAQVFDNPILQVLVGKRVRKRLDASSIVQLLHRICAPPGTKVYIEQAFPLPQDGKQGCWCVGFTFGLWIGILVASGYSVVPIAPRVWKNHFQLYGSSFGKDDSRRVASMLFPSMSSSFKRKKDHGRAEALLIAACGKGLKLEPEDSIALVDCNSNNC